jgi:hypothetical protein
VTHERPFAYIEWTCEGCLRLVEVTYNPGDEEIVCPQCRLPLRPRQ